MYKNLNRVQDADAHWTLRNILYDDDQMATR